MHSDTPLPLAGIQVLEIGGGAAAAYCGRLLADAGATVRSTAPDDARRLAGILRADTPAEQAYAAWLAAGKQVLPAAAGDALAALRRGADLVLLGEDAGEVADEVADEAAGTDAPHTRPRIASIRLHWFGPQSPLRHWRGSDLVVQALTGMPQMAGTVDGPPLSAGDRQATLLAGVTAYIAACAAVLGAARQPGAGPRRLDVSILEANLVMAEMHMHFYQRDGLPMRRCGINRFAPNSPVGIYPCRSGWVGITVATPEQWRGLCRALDLHAQAQDEGLATRELRFARLDEVEAVLCQALARHSADEWAAIGRQHRVPIVVVPDADGMLAHPIFQARQSLATLQHGGQALQVPRTPFGLTATPLPTQLGGTTAAPAPAAPRGAASDGPAPTAPPLQGVTIVDFSMGWAGPLAARLLADLGAEVLKIEAGRYPDWWRGMNWTPAFIDAKDYERATIFCGMNRGKQGISIDLTTPTGRDLALQLVARADAVVENQAAGVMAKFGLDYPALAQARPGLVMCSMSAFGTGNAWSDTRAYGSTLEQGSGLPGFTGLPGTAPTMTHLAHGDPVGGLYGCAALLTGLVHRQRGGAGADGAEGGQYVNLSMVEAMLQLTTPGLLMHQVQPGAALRRGNRRDSLAPHGFYPAAGTDQWLAVSVDGAGAFAALARTIGRADWAADATLQTLAGRQAQADAIDAAIAAWTRRHGAEAAATLLQAAGVPAAALLHAEHLGQQPHLAAVDFYIDVDRAVSGPQRQCGLAILQNGRRLGAHSPAPLLGEHSAAVLQRHAGVTPGQFGALVAQGVVSLAPKPERNLLTASTTAPAPAR
jgi:crotonobetainyl-CoA:carnitine CoA-transferase CaiB-like acyl-CoA transferase